MTVGTATVNDAWWVLLPTPTTRGQPAALARMPAGHRAFAAHAEVRRLAGGFEEGAPTQLQATGGGRGGVASVASNAPPAPPAGGCGRQGPGRPRSGDDGGGPPQQHCRQRSAVCNASHEGARGARGTGAVTEARWVGMEPGGEAWGPPPLKPRLTGAGGRCSYVRGPDVPGQTLDRPGVQGRGTPGVQPGRGACAIRGGCGACKGAPARGCWPVGMLSRTLAQGARGVPRGVLQGGAGVDAILGTFAACHGARPDPHHCLGPDPDPDPDCLHKRAGRTGGPVASCGIDPAPARAVALCAHPGLTARAEVRSCQALGLDIRRCTVGPERTRGF